MAMMLDTATAVRRAAMDLLARREHGHVELTRKLRKRGAPDELIQAELGRLADEGLLDESRYLESFIASRARAGYGPLRIREDLQQRGMPRQVVEQAINDAGFDWAEQARELWQRRFGQLPQDRRELAQQGRFLAYRGYPAGLIGRLLNNRID